MMMVTKMNIINETNFRTDDLRRFIVSGLRAMGADVSRPTVFTIKYSRGAHTTGWARYDGSRVLLRLPADLDSGAEFRSNYNRASRRDSDWTPLREAARVLEHEIAHTLGLKHRDMTTALRWCRAPWPTWVEGTTLRIKGREVEVQTPADTTTDATSRADSREDVLKKLHRAEAMVKRWSARLGVAHRTYDLLPPMHRRRVWWSFEAIKAAKKTKEWKTKVKYYTRRLENFSEFEAA
jgi:hypothetical protein